MSVCAPSPTAGRGVPRPVGSRRRSRCRPGPACRRAGWGWRRLRRCRYRGARPAAARWARTCVRCAVRAAGCPPCLPSGVQKPCAGRASRRPMCGNAATGGTRACGGAAQGAGRPRGSSARVGCSGGLAACAALWCPLGCHGGNYVISPTGARGFDLTCYNKLKHPFTRTAAQRGRACEVTKHGKQLPKE